VRDLPEDRDFARFAGHIQHLCALGLSPNATRRPLFHFTWWAPLAESLKPWAPLSRSNPQTADASGT
jgi:hypothetical protein